MNYYEILGVSENCSQADIKKAYRAKAQKIHPDKGGNKEEFEKLLEAYNCLKNPQSREYYDVHKSAPNHRPFDVDSEIAAILREIIADERTMRQGNLVSAIQQEIRNRISNINMKMISAMKVMEMLENNKERIHTEDGEVKFDFVFQGVIHQIDDVVKDMKKSIEQLEEVLDGTLDLIDTMAHMELEQAKRATTGTTMF